VKRKGIVVGLAAAVLAVSAGIAVFGQDFGAKPDSAKVGRYAPIPGNAALGVFDTASGALYFCDPADPKEVVSLDLVGCQAFVRELAKDASGWGAVELPKLDPAVIAARASVFVASGKDEVVDTRTGAVYYLETPPKTKVADWKGVQVARVDPVLGTIVRRELHVSKRGG
jgi:hypothetical protein